MHLGTGKQIISCWIFLLLLLTARAQDEKSYKYLLKGGLQTSVSIKENGSLVIDYSISEIDLRNIISENGDFYRLSIPGHISSSDPGKPELPVYSNLITIPDGSDYKIKISQVKSTRIRPSLKEVRGILYPAQESEVKQQRPEKRIFRFDSQTYSRKSFIPADTARIVMLGKVRNNNLANLYISPVRYNPRSNILEIIISMKIEVIFSLPSGTKSIIQESVSTNESLGKGVLNYKTQLIPGYTDKPIGMIILTDTSFRKQLKPFIDWKTQKGFNIKILYKGASFAGTTYTELKDTLANIYKSSTEIDPAPDYLLIIGDVNIIPYYGAGGSGNVTDMYYGEFDGSGDYIPELYVGRLPVKDTTELKSVVKKIIQYEKFGFAPENTFYSKALASTGSDAVYSAYTNGQVRYSVMNYLIGENKIKESHFYHPQADIAKQKDSIIKIINTGTSFINYTGHGDVAGWLLVGSSSTSNSSNFKVLDTALLKNRNMYPLIISNACRTAAFNNANSFGNRLVLEKNRGAIGFIGCSNDSYWDEDYFWAVGLGPITENPTYAGKGPGIFDRYFHTHSELPSEWYHTLGQINYAGNLSVSASTTQRKKYYWETYNVVGDPSLIPIIGTPDSFNIQLPDTLPNGIKSLSLNIEPFAYVAVSHFNTLWDASFGGVSGSVVLEMPGLSNDSCLLVITGQNKYPIIKTIYFSNVGKEFLNLSGTTINDAAGNNNNKADFGESFYLALKLSNLGLTDSYDVYTKISTGSDWLMIVKDSAFVGLLPHESEIYLSDKILLKVIDNVPDMSLASVDILLKSRDSEKKYKLDFILHSPELQILSCTVNDREMGNGDYIADPGETFNLVFKVRNQGTSDASGQLNLTSANNELTILETTVKSGVLKSGESTDISVQVKLAGSSPSGSYISVSSELTFEPFRLEKDFSFRVGKVREGFEALSFNIFPWINRSPVPWIFTESSSVEGSFSARSGAIRHNASTTLQIKTAYATADTLKFYCKVSSEPNYDYLSFVLNGKEIFKKSGEVPWTKINVPIQAGLNKMEWIYKKDQSDLGVSQDCAWIDMIDFASTGSVNYIRKDLHVAKIESPSTAVEEFGQEILTVKVINSGRDNINGFNLAYSVNGKPAVKQYFTENILPGSDSLTVSFTPKMDLSKYGNYNIVVYGYNNNDDYIHNDTLSLELQNTKITESLSIYPNPYMDEFTVFINSQYREKVRFTLTNVSGKIMYSIEKELISGGNTIKITDARLAPSLYYLNIRGENFNKTVPLMRIK